MNNSEQLDLVCSLDGSNTLLHIRTYPIEEGRKVWEDYVLTVKSKLGARSWSLALVGKAKPHFTTTTHTKRWHSEGCVLAHLLTEELFGVYAPYYFRTDSNILGRAIPTDMVALILPIAKTLSKGEYPIPLVTNQSKASVQAFVQGEFDSSLTLQWRKNVGFGVYLSGYNSIREFNLSTFNTNELIEELTLIAGRQDVG